MHGVGCATTLSYSDRIRPGPGGRRLQGPCQRQGTTARPTLRVCQAEGNGDFIRCTPDHLRAAEAGGLQGALQDGAELSVGERDGVGAHRAAGGIGHDGRDVCRGHLEG
jgi:hypothetical protein